MRKKKKKQQVEERTFWPERVLPPRWIEKIREERGFLMLTGLLFLITGVFYETPRVAMWIGFFFAAYSAIANDSIQTIGTFMASNADKKWWMLWLWIGGIFIVTVSYSWVTYSGDVTYERLTSRGFDEAPSTFKFLQVAAPLFLLILTRLRMPVSTTFLLLSAFATQPEGIIDVLNKSLSGYVVAFIVAIFVWLALGKLLRILFTGKAAAYWLPLQWIVSGFLWAVWLMQDAANIAVYLPRSLGVSAFLVFTGFIFFGLGILFYLRGDKIQKIVTEKSYITDVRSATVIDGVYAAILFYFKNINVIPMSTTWVFIGLLAGREVAMSFTDAKGRGRPMSHSLKLIVKDASYALIGLIISILIAVAINPVIWEELVEYFFS